jgi:lantibiotic modifying enzyme
VDIHFAELLEWLNERGDHPSFRMLKVIDRRDYGWVEFVKTGECSSQMKFGGFIYAKVVYWLCFMPWRQHIFILIKLYVSAKL